MPSRATLARRMHKKSTDSVDRALKELVATGAVSVEHRYNGGQRLTNAYHVRTSRPAQHDPGPPPKLCAWRCMQAGWGMPALRRARSLPRVTRC